MAKKFSTRFIAMLVAFMMCLSTNITASASASSVTFSEHSTYRYEMPWVGTTHTHTFSGSSSNFTLNLTSSKALSKLMVSETGGNPGGKYLVSVKVNGKDSGMIFVNSGDGWATLSSFTIAPAGTYEFYISSYFGVPQSDTMLYVRLSN